MPDDIDASVWMLRKTIADLIALRFSNADRMADEFHQISAALTALKNLVADMRELHPKLEAAE